ncbi:PPE-PPW subfamily C-terminal domain-containing protein [Mycobacterium senriense]
MNVEVDPDWSVPRSAETLASASGAGPAGFAGTARSAVAPTASGLATLAGDEFGGGPTMPMMPGTWDADDANQGTQDGEGRDGSPG